MSPRRDWTWSSIVLQDVANYWPADTRRLESSCCLSYIWVTYQKGYQKLTLQEMSTECYMSDVIALLLFLDVKFVNAFWKKHFLSFLIPHHTFLLCQTNRCTVHHWDIVSRRCTISISSKVFLDVYHWLCSMLEALLFLQPQLISHRGHSPNL